MEFVPNGLSGRGIMLYHALQKEPMRWFTRQDLADATGKRNLSPHDWGLLERMRVAGLVSVDYVTAGGRKFPRYRFLK